MLAMTGSNDHQPDHAKKRFVTCNIHTTPHISLPLKNHFYFPDRMNAPLQSCRRLYQLGGLTPTTDTSLFLTTYRGESHLPADI